MRTNRRRFLTGAVLAATASTAGCLVGGSEGDDPTDTTTPHPGGDVTVEAVTVVPEVVTYDSPDSYGVYGSRDSQYVIAEIEVDDPDHRPPGSFGIEVGDATYPATNEIGRAGGWLPDFGNAYDSRGADEPGVGWIAVQAANPLVGDATLVWEGGEYEFGERASELLARQPADFQVSLDVPASAEVGETVTATVTVENVGDVDGTFVGALNRVGPLVAYAPEAAIVLDAETGESATWEFTHDLDERLEDREDPRMRLHLRWDDRRITREVDIERS